ncbi:Deoxyuridine 5'-triphosphate nucleotidohydrolase [Candidatus Sulfotelmatomonas gaucii]|uniref:dUTP diphosphatase n=1 Tax=Candidatus Sulfuritelmatomonas gaucii TaxID=2043161 RepID=A0A2N9L449_9BACT|nr:Deoxyuridine 5'-triphosphate nucleotidohydrolase [Candidatus Sulfotelmatomonas gaucii]
MEAGARLPAVAHPGEDLGYDVFALEDTLLEPRQTVKLRTGVAVEARYPATGEPLGLLVRDRSSMAARGLATTGGVIDAGYRGEILVVMTNLGDEDVELKAGEKIAQMVPIRVLTGPVEEVSDLEGSERAAKGFGSSGR